MDYGLINYLQQYFYNPGVYYYTISFSYENSSAKTFFTLFNETVGLKPFHQLAQPVRYARAFTPVLAIIYYL